MSNKAMPLFTILICIAFVVVGAWYIMSLTKADVTTLEPITSTKAAVNAKSLRDAADKAANSLTSLKVYGKIPLDSGGLERNPDPLFNASH